MRREGLRVRFEKEEEEERGEGGEGAKEEEEEEEEEYATADFGGPIRREGLRFRVDLRLASLSLSLSLSRSLARSPLSTRASSLCRFCRVTDSRLSASLSLSRAPPARNSQKSMTQCSYCTTSHAADF
jgi:hypothetical protein